MGAFKACPRCGRIHRYDEPCPMKKDYRLYQKDTDANRFRQSSKWRRKSIQVREMSGNVCAVCLDNGIINYKNLEVHHIEPLESRLDLCLDDDNLICLCSTCHHKAERGEISKEYLKRLVKKRDEGF